MKFDYKIDLIADVKLVADSRGMRLTDNQIESIACKIFSDYSFNELIENLLKNI